jgi:hypothetical protein
MLCSAKLLHVLCSALPQRTGIHFRLNYVMLLSRG